MFRPDYYCKWKGLWGIKVTIKQEEDVAIPAFTGTFREEHMKPNELGGKE